MLHRYAGTAFLLGVLAFPAQAQSTAMLAAAVGHAPTGGRRVAAPTPEAPHLGHKALRTGIELHDKGDYAAAIAEYLRVPASDSAYADVLAELATSYWANKQYAEAATSAQRALDLGLRSPQPYVTLANSQEELKQLDACLNTFQEGIRRYPMYSMLWFNRAVTRANQPTQTAAAIADFQRSLTLRALHPGSHMQLGRIEAMQGHPAHALLGILAYLMLEPGSDYSHGALVLAEQIAGGSLQLDAEDKRPATSPNEPFADLDQLIDARVALRADYKSKVNFKAAIVKQTQLLVEKFPLDNSSTDFWQRTYGPLIEELRAGDNLTTFTYLILNSADDQRAAKWVASNKAKISKLRDAARLKLLKLSDFQTVQRNGQPVRVEAWFYNSGAISGLGDAKRDAAGKAIKEGPWQLFDDNGNLEAEGSYQNDHPTGNWRFYYADGTLFRDMNFDADGKRTGAFKEYHDNGMPYVDGTYRANEPVGKARLFHPCGALSEERTYSDAGQMEGPYVRYYPNGQVKTRGTYHLDKREGAQTNYYSDGSPQAEMTVVADQEQGPYTSYFAGPGRHIDMQGTADKGELHGPITYYFANGQVREKGAFNKGKRTGQWQRYYADGKLAVEQSYDDAGLLHGPHREADFDGVVYSEITYEHDRARKYQYLDKTGKVLQQGASGKTEAAVRGLRPDGAPNYTGTYRNGLLNGDWTYVYRHGTPSVLRRFRDDKLEGVQEEYHPNGKIKSRTAYADGQKNGHYERFDANGTLRQEGWFMDGEQHGLWHDYYASGQLSEETGYYKGAQHGTRRSFTPTGKLWLETWSKAGVNTRFVEYDSVGKARNDIQLKPETESYTFLYPSGQVRARFKLKCQQLVGVEWFSPAGKVSSSYSMRDDDRDGPYRTYHDNGQLATEGSYENGQKSGEWKYYTEAGKLRHKGTYRQGEEDGEWTYYHPNGRVSATESYREGEKHGLSRSYDPAGQLIYEKNYVRDDIMAWRHLLPNGQPGPWQDLSSQQGTVKSYFPNGKLAAEETYRNGLFEGKRRLYHSNGQLLHEEEMHDGQNQGTERVWSAEGKLLSEETYAQGELNGRSRYFRPDGTLEREETWRSGEKDGPTVHYNAQGRPQRTDIYFSNFVYGSK